MSESFGKKEEQTETCPGGSASHRYDRRVWSPSQIGFTDESTAKLSEVRGQLYKRFFGEPHTVFKEAIPLIPHVDVHAYYRRSQGGRAVCTLVTSGMSDLEMSVPAGDNAPRRTELIFYCAEPR